MVHFSAVLSLFALYLSATVALPLPEDSALGNEVGVSAPNGIVMSDTEELNHNRMLSTSDVSPSPSGTDYVSPSSTWTPPAPLPTEDGKDQSLPSYSYSSEYVSPTPTYESGNNSWDVSPTPSYEAQPSPTYGSGSNSWGNDPFDDCVKQCQAKYPALSSPTETPTKTGTTHVVWVAPTQGVLRYVPFAVNASVGDTVKFIWGANNHTVTKGSQLTPCNKTLDAPFASGIQLKDFVFEQVVNDTNPTFFYCAVPNHCTKGMFGIINPPNAIAGPSSVGSMMQPMVDANANLDKMRTYADNATKDSDHASKWGTNLDMANIPEWAQESFMENVLYSRTFFAANADALNDNGEVDASLGGNPPVIPQEITQVALDNTPGYGYGSDPASPSSVTSTSTVDPSPTSTSVDSAANLNSNGSASVTRSGMTVFLAALAAGFFLL
jgi:plastocyanin